MINTIKQHQKFLKKLHIPKEVWDCFPYLEGFEITTLGYKKVEIVTQNTIDQLKRDHSCIPIGKYTCKCGNRMTIKDLTFINYYDGSISLKCSQCGQWHGTEMGGV